MVSLCHLCRPREPNERVIVRSTIPLQLTTSETLESFHPKEIALNSLFWKILPVTLTRSRFCRPFPKRNDCFQDFRGIWGEGGIPSFASNRVHSRDCGVRYLLVNGRRYFDWVAEYEPERGAVTEKDTKEIPSSSVSPCLCGENPKERSAHRHGFGRGCFNRLKMCRKVAQERGFVGQSHAAESAHDAPIPGE